MTKKNILKAAIASAAVMVAAAIFCGAYYSDPYNSKEIYESSLGLTDESCPWCGESVCPENTACAACGAYYSGDDELCPWCGTPGCPKGTQCNACWGENCPDVIGETRGCKHPKDQVYTEPTIKPGKYYRNGDVNSCYLELTESTWQLIPTDNCSIETLYGEMNHWSDEAPADPTTAPGADANPELTEERIKSKEELIAFYSQPHEYTVITWHPFDVTFLCAGPGVPLIEGDENPAPEIYIYNGHGYPGPTVVDENTLTGFGPDNYILVE